MSGQREKIAKLAAELADDPSVEQKVLERINSNELLDAEATLKEMTEVLELRYKVFCGHWSREQAEQHFKDRDAIMRVRQFLTNEAELSLETNALNQGSL